MSNLLSANAAPLPDVLPWADALPPNRTVLVNDSAGTDGRFLLHTLACQTLRGGGSSGSGRSGGSSGDSTASPPPSSFPSGGRVLWLGCTAASAKQIASALKKIGGDASLTAAAAAAAAAQSSSRRLEIVPIMLEAATDLLSSDGAVDGDDGKNHGWYGAFAGSCLRKLYGRIGAWLDESSSGAQPNNNNNNLIVVDDATSLATVFGPREAEFFVRQVRSRALRCRRAGSGSGGSSGTSMVILCSADADQDRHLTAAAAGEGGGAAVVNVAGGGGSSTKSTWLGAGSDVYAVEQDYRQLVGGTAGPGAAWERNLIELADGIVDVMPLQSGFSLEAHGRLVFTERKGGQGWRDVAAPVPSGRRLGSSAARPTSSSSSVAAGAPAFLTAVVNYCCEENSIKAFRLRSSAS